MLIPNAPFKQIVTIDFETKWDSKDYTLSKMTTEAYIRDERFKAFGACLHELGDSRPAQWYRGNELERILSCYDWTKTAVLAHNALFDVGIMCMRYGVQPCFILDSLSMGRAKRGVEVGNSLAKLADAYGLPPKGKAVHTTDGVDELTPAMESELAAYCSHDVYLCEQIFSKLFIGAMPDGTQEAPYPTKELRLIDMTMKMFAFPSLVLDTPLLEEAVAEDDAKLQKALTAASVDATSIGSNDVFAEALKATGVEAPMKPSPSNKEKMIYAFAKTDALFQALLNGDNEEAALLCEARLRVKSTQERTRSQRFIDIAQRGALPVPLLYYGASTGRWSATGSINLQNIKRGSKLRKAIMAPDGYVILAGDLSQIEPRVLAWEAGYGGMLDIFRAGGDPYAHFGADMFSIPGLNKDEHPLLRQSAKSALLGAGYMLSWSAFAAQLLVGFMGAPPVRYEKDQAKQLGVTMHDVQRFLGWEDNVEKMVKIPHTCSDEELLIHCLAAKAIIDKYRSTAQPVVDYWSMLGELLERSLIGGEVFDYKGIFQFRKGEIEMPNGMCLRYPDIQKETKMVVGRPRTQYTYDTGKMRKNLHPGVLANNTTQGLSRIVMSDGLLRVQKRYFVAGTVHDEGLFLVPEGEAEEAKKWVHAQMTQTPKYLPGIPLNADVGYNKRYGLAKG